MWTLNHELDDTDWRILDCLQRDARLSYAELGRRVGMSSPAVQERVRKMEDAGVITGYRAELNLTKIGLPITAYVRVGNMGGLDEHRLEELVTDLAEVIECHHITGEDCYLVRVAAQSIPHLEQVIGKFIDFTNTTTSVVLSSPVEKRIFNRPEEDILSADDDTQARRWVMRR